MRVRLRLRLRVRVRARARVRVRALGHHLGGAAHVRTPSRWCAVCREY